MAVVAGGGIAFGPRAGQKVLTLQRTMPRETKFNQTLCADMQGFSLHAAVRCDADDRQALEQLCRTITRPAPANERMQCNAAGQVVLKLKTPWRDGTTHQGTPPLEFMQRLAALVPRPRLHPRKGRTRAHRQRHLPSARRTARTTARRPGPRGSAAPGLRRTEAKRPNQLGNPGVGRSWPL